MAFVRSDLELRRIVRQNYLLVMHTEYYENERLKWQIGLQIGENKEVSIY
jgi:hypothetical protein